MTGTLSKEVTDEYEQLPLSGIDAAWDMDTEVESFIPDITTGESPPEPPKPEMTNLEIPTEIANIIQGAPSGVDILTKCINLAVFLSAKNTAYGNSALNPARIFSKADATEQLLVRIDDKINRLMHGTSVVGDDDILDLVGYLILYLVQRDRNAANETA